MLEYNLDKKGENVIIFFFHKTINYIYKIFFIVQFFRFIEF